MLALAVGLWLSVQPTAEGRLTDGILPDVIELTEPDGFAVTATEDDPDTAFQEDAAGFSSYYRVTDEQGKPVALEVPEVTMHLLRKPDESNSVRAQLAGSAVDIGSNFSIITLPMVAAAGVVVAPQDVTVYYDNEGWIAAYLAADQPAAAFWKHDPADTTTPKQELSDNLLVLAINEVINAHNEATPEAEHLTRVTHDGDADGNYKVKYYDWQNADCNAFILFTDGSNGGAPTPVNFVIPHTIQTEDIMASAAALITRQQAEGAATFATMTVDGEIVAAALASDMLDVASFTLERAGDKTSLHNMSVAVSEGESAVGAVMLLYKKPN